MRIGTTIVEGNVIVGSDNTGQGKSPIGMQEVLAIGLGAAALLRIRRRRQKEAAEREAAERSRQAEDGNTGKPGASQA
jgi:F0F1-type ATP synthase assembly protein I